MYSLQLLDRIYYYIMRKNEYIIYYDHDLFDCARNPSTDQGGASAYHDQQTPHDLRWLWLLNTCNNKS